MVNGDGKLEEIIVCSNEIAASTAQLVVASNVSLNLFYLKKKEFQNYNRNLNS